MKRTGHVARKVKRNAYKILVGKAEGKRPLGGLGSKIKVKLSLCLTKHHAMKTYWRNGGISPRILDLGTRGRLVVTFTPRSLYPQGKIPWYPRLNIKMYL
jgi:hypothetical protein